MKFKVKLGLILIVVILVVSVLISSIGFVLSKSTQSKSSDEVLKLTAELAKDNIERWIREKATTIDAVAKVLASEHDSYSEVKDENLNAYCPESGLKSIYTISQKNEVRDSGNWRPNQGDDLTTRDYYQGALANDGVYYSEVYIDSDSLENVITISQPLKDKNGELWGIIATDSGLAEISTFIESLQIYGGKGTAFLLTEKDTIMYHEDEAIFSLHADETEHLSEVVPYLKAHVNEAVSYDYMGEKSMMYAVEIPSTRWLVVIAIPTKVIYENVNQMGVYFIGAIAIVLIMGMFGTYYIASRVGKDFESISTYISKISDYDLSYASQTNFSNRKDEFGIIYNNILHLQNNFKTHVLALVENNRQLNTTSKELDVISRDVTMASEDISRFVEDLSQGAMSQAEDTESGAMQMADLGHAIENNVAVVNRVIASTQGVQETVDDGLNVVNKLVELTYQNGVSSKEIYNVIHQTEENSKKIRNASDLIAGIAEQTNLLALNAAIEAARAGDAGKGFAVVAEEIRKLAEESAKSTRSINEVVEELNKNASYAVEKMEEVSRIVEKQEESVKNTEGKYNEIEHSISEVGQLMKEVVNSTEVMEASKKKIIEVLDTLAAIAEQNAASAQETSASTTQQTEKMKTVHDYSLTLQKMATKLKEEIDKFEV